MRRVQLEPQVLLVLQARRVLLGLLVLLVLQVLQAPQVQVRRALLVPRVRRLQARQE